MYCRASCGGKLETERVIRHPVSVRLPGRSQCLQVRTLKCHFHRVARVRTTPAKVAAVTGRQAVTVVLRLPTRLIQPQQSKCFRFKIRLFQAPTKPADMGICLHCRQSCRSKLGASFFHHGSLDQRRHDTVRHRDQLLCCGLRLSRTRSLEPQRSHSGYHRVPLLSDRNRWLRLTNKAETIASSI